LSVTAEGVERQEQADFLLGLGCNAFQGHLYSAALSSEGATAWLRDHEA
jgi:EAL domain-containing protein (putative c-di-GMP-specific phosphodiesterase class I)